MPRRISSRSSRVSEAAIASRRRKPSQASSSSARACSSAPRRGRPRRRSRQALRQPAPRVQAPRQLAPRTAGAARRSPPRRAASAAAADRLEGVERIGSANGWRSATNAPRRAATPVVRARSAGRGMGRHSSSRPPWDSTSRPPDDGAGRARAALANRLRCPAMRRSVLLIPAVLLSACSATSPAPQGPAITLAVVNATVWTGNPGSPRREAVAVARRPHRRGRLHRRDPEACRHGADVIDAGGQMLVPGFIDCHVHFIDGGFAPRSVQLRDAQDAGRVRRAHHGVRRDACRRAPGSPAATGTTQLWGGELPRRELDRLRHARTTRCG